MKAIILAAGKGERLRPLTENLPKPMICINGKPVLEYLILLCKKHGVTEIGINTSYLPEKIKEYFGDGSKWGVKLYFSFEEELLGTSGALNNFRDFLKDDSFFLIYGDNVTDINLTELMNFHKKNQSMATLALRKKSVSKKPVSLVFVDDNFKITNFVEKPSDQLFHDLCKEFYFSNSGIYALDKKILDYVPKGYSDFAYDLFPKMLENKEKLFAFMMDNYYFREVGTVEKYELAKKEIESGLYKLSFIEGKTKAVFLDKDGVINENLYEIDGQIMAPASIDQIELLPNVKEGLMEIKKQGFKTIIITNQPGLAFGYIDEKKFEDMVNFLKSELPIDGFYYCPHHPSKGKVTKFIKACECRKPNQFMLNAAAQELNIDLSESYMVGDSLSDIQTGSNAGVKKTFLIGIVREDVLEIQHKKGIFPDFTCKDLLEVSKKISEIN